RPPAPGPARRLPEPEGRRPPLTAHSHNSRPTPLTRTPASLATTADAPDPHSRQPRNHGRPPGPADALAGYRDHVGCGLDVGGEPGRERAAAEHDDVGQERGLRAG